MNILYLSCHKPLEFDEVTVFTELGHNVDVISNYAIVDDDKEKGVRQRDENFNVLYDVTGTCTPTSLPINVDINKYDIVYIVHHFDWIIQNWEKIKTKKVILRLFQSACQPISNIQYFRDNGLAIVRYSPFTEYSSDVKKFDRVIRFHKDEDEFSNWNGSESCLMTVCNNITMRPTYCHLDVYHEVSKQFDRKLYGRGNSMLEILGGKVDYSALKKGYRDNRVFLNLGTYPGPYTLSFVEAFMTGIPVVALGKMIAHDDKLEIPSFINNGVNGFCADSVNELIHYVGDLMNDYDLAQRISKAGRETAIEIFGKKKIKNQWKELFNSLGKE
jgi:hypothetical protein